MKIIVLHNSVEPDNKNSVPAFYSKVDSTLLKGGKPFFIPDFAQQCELSIHLVARICRLGKGFSSRYAYRYVDAWTLGATFVAQNMKQDGMYIPSQAVDFDGSTMIGDFIMTQDIDMDTSKCKMQLGDCSYGDISLSQLGSTILDTVSRLSYFFTWKQGDLLFSLPLCCKPNVIENEHVSCEINNRLLLDFNIK